MSQANNARTTIRHWVLMTATALVALVGCAAAQASGASAADARSGAIGGVVDANLTTGHGRTLGFLQGDIGPTGRGMLTFAPARGTRLSAQTVTATARAAAGGKIVLRGVGDSLRVHGLIHSDRRLSGRGRLGHRAVRLAGLGRQPLVKMARGKRMLVVGHPSGEGYRVLKRVFTPVRYRSHDTRAALLRHPNRFRRFAALVLAPDARLDPRTADGLLRTFYGDSRWVIAARPRGRALALLSELVPAVQGQGSPAIAVRSFGPRGNSSQMRPTVAYPSAPKLSDRSLARAAAAQRARWFRSELLRFGEASEPSGGPQSSLGTGIGSFNMPDNCTCFVIAVPYNEQFTLNSEQNSLRSEPCAWNADGGPPGRWDAWCEDTWRWQNVKNGLENGSTAGTCNRFMDNGYDITNSHTVHTEPGGSNSLNNDGAYTLNLPPNRLTEPGFVQSKAWGDRCPDQQQQVGNIQGNDYYWAIYNDKTRSDTLVAVSDPTVDATIADGGALAHENDNGSGRDWSSGFWQGVFFPEDAFFLGDYKDTLRLNGDHLTNTSLLYSGSQSVPQNQITWSSSTGAVSKTTSFSVGVFGSSGTGTYGESQTVSADVTISVPDWTVIPTTPSHSVSYDWQTNTPLSWGTITNGAQAPFHQLNDLNHTNFSPASVTVWTGDAIWGKVNVDVTHQLSLVDHWSTYDVGTTDFGGYHPARKEGYNITTFTYHPTPDVKTPNTTNPVGPGINFCDPKVRAPEFVDQCTGGT